MNLEHVQVRHWRNDKAVSELGGLWRAMCRYIFFNVSDSGQHPADKWPRIQTAWCEIRVSLEERKQEYLVCAQWWEKDGERQNKTKTHSWNNNNNKNQKSNNNKKPWSRRGISRPDGGKGGMLVSWAKTATPLPCLSWANRTCPHRLLGAAEPVDTLLNCCHCMPWAREQYCAPRLTFNIFGHLLLMGHISQPFTCPSFFSPAALWGWCPYSLVRKLRWREAKHSPQSNNWDFPPRRSDSRTPPPF